MLESVQSAVTGDALCWKCTKCAWLFLVPGGPPERRQTVAEYEFDRHECEPAEDAGR